MIWVYLDVTGYGGLFQCVSPEGKHVKMLGILVHTCIHTYIHTYINIYMYIYM